MVSYNVFDTGPSSRLDVINQPECISPDLHVEFNYGLLKLEYDGPACTFRNSFEDLLARFVDFIVDDYEKNTRQTQKEEDND